MVSELIIRVPVMKSSRHLFSYSKFIDFPVDNLLVICLFKFSLIGQMSDSSLAITEYEITVGYLIFMLFGVDLYNS